MFYWICLRPSRDLPLQNGYCQANFQSIQWASPTFWTVTTSRVFAAFLSLWDSLSNSRETVDMNCCLFSLIGFRSLCFNQIHVKTLHSLPFDDRILTNVRHVVRKWPITALRSRLSVFFVVRTALGINFIVRSEWSHTNVFKRFDRCQTDDWFEFHELPIIQHAKKKFIVCMETFQILDQSVFSCIVHARMIARWTEPVVVCERINTKQNVVGFLWSHSKRLSMFISVRNF